MGDLKHMKKLSSCASPKPRDLLSYKGRRGDVPTFKFQFEKLRKRWFSCLTHDGSMGRTVYLPSFKFIYHEKSTIHVGKYTSPIHGSYGKGYISCWCSKVFQPQTIDVLIDPKEGGVVCHWWCNSQKVA